MNTSIGIERWRVPEALWEQMECLLPLHPNTHRFGGGRPRRPDRDCADAIFYVLRTGCPWKALDATRFVPGSTAHDRFQEWVAAGFFLKLWEAGLLEYDFFKGIAWKWLSMDGAMTKAPLGGEETGPNPTDRAKQGVKRSIVTDGRGVPIGLAVAGANRVDFKMARATLEGFPVERPPVEETGKQHMCLDKGYDYPEIDELMEEFRFTAHIARRGEAKQEVKRSVRKKARRYVAERAHSWMNRFRAILIRWNKKVENYLALLHFALAFIAYRASGLFG
jgi:putative transposase